MPVTLSALAAIAAGAVLGAISRWLLALALNTVNPLIPLGTLAANLIGGYLIGLAAAFFAGAPGVAPEWRLFVITGFLGALTTFSAFSYEVAALIQLQRLFAACTVIGLNLFGSLAMTFLGMGTISLCKSLGR